MALQSDKQFYNTLIDYLESAANSYVVLSGTKIVSNVERLQDEVEQFSSSFRDVETFLEKSKFFTIGVSYYDRERKLYYWVDKAANYSDIEQQFQGQSVTQIAIVDKKGQSKSKEADRLILNALTDFYNAFAVDIGDEYLFSYLIGTIIKLTSSEVGLLTVFQDNERRDYSMGFNSTSLDYIKYDGKNITDFLLETREILMVHDVEADEKLQLSLEHSGFIKTFIFAPILSKGEVIAIIYLINKSFPLVAKDVDDYDYRFLSTLSIQIASIISNALLYKKIIELNDFNENILENIPAGILSATAEGEVIFSNKYMRDLTARISVPSEDFLFIINEKSEGEFFNQEFKIPAQPGIMYFSVSKRFIKIGEKPGFYLYTIIDISQEKDMEIQLIKTEKLAVAGELISGIAHEIKNPLTSIKGFADLLSQRIDDKDFVLKFANIVSNEVNRLNNIIERFLSFARPDIGVMSVVNLNDTINEVIEIVAFHIRQNNIELLSKIEYDINIYGNKELLTQVFMNMILNSIQAFRDMERDKNMIQIFASVINNKVELVFEDNGVGIAKENQEKVFNPFYTTKSQGSGLGLSISYKIINEHRGSIVIDSKKGEYTRMIMSFPVYKKGGETG